MDWHIDLLSSVMSKHVIIIGAGPAGLTAAYELLFRSQDYTVTVIEASEQVGGISKTVNYKGNRMDIGGHRFFSKSDRVMEWWQNILPLAELSGAVDIAYQGKTTSFTPLNANTVADSDKVFLVRNRLSRIYFLRKFFTYPVSLSLETIKNLGIVRMCKIGFSYLYIRLFPIKKENTLEDFFINRFGKELYLTFFKDYTEKVWGFKCNEISKEWGAQRIKGLSVSKTLIHAFKKIIKKDQSIGQKSTETSLIEKFLYPKLGPGQMWETVTEMIVEKGAQVIMETEVVGLSKAANGSLNAVTVKDKSGDIQIIEGDLFFSTMAIKDLFEAFNFETDSSVKSIATNLPYRDFITVGLLCNKLNLSDKSVIDHKNHLVPDNWIYIQEREVKIGRLQIFNNWSPFMVADSSKVWMGLEYFCNEGDELWSKSDLEFIEFAKKEIELIGIAKQEEIIDAHIVRVKKTYPAYTGSYSEFDKVKTYLDSIPNLYPIGRNGMHKYNNSDHSMLTAMTAVDLILEGSGKKEILWQINTEEEYHEEK